MRLEVISSKTHEEEQFTFEGFVSVYGNKDVLEGIRQGEVRMFHDSEGNFCTVMSNSDEEDDEQVE